MNFQCEPCGQKYQVADEKLQGRPITRFRCKKCQHIIELRPPETAAAAPVAVTAPAPATAGLRAPMAPMAPRARAATMSAGTPGPRAAVTAPVAGRSAGAPLAPRARAMTMTAQPVAAVAAPAVAAAVRPESVPAPSTADLLDAMETGWYAGIRDLPVGPLTRGEVSERARSGDITHETLVWREGMANWLPLRDVASLRAIAPPVRLALVAQSVPPPAVAAHALAAPALAPDVAALETEAPARHTEALLLLRPRTPAPIPETPAVHAPAPAPEAPPPAEPPVPAAPVTAPVAVVTAPVAVVTAPAAVPAPVAVPVPVPAPGRPARRRAPGVAVGLVVAVAAVGVGLSQRHGGHGPVSAPSTARAPQAVIQAPAALSHPLAAVIQVPEETDPPVQPTAVPEVAAPPEESVEPHGGTSIHHGHHGGSGGHAAAGAAPVVTRDDLAYLRMQSSSGTVLRPTAPVAAAPRVMVPMVGMQAPEATPRDFVNHSGAARALDHSGVVHRCWRQFILRSPAAPAQTVRIGIHVGADGHVTSLSTGAGTDPVLASCIAAGARTVHVDNSAGAAYDADTSVTLSP